MITEAVFWYFISVSRKRGFGLLSIRRDLGYLYTIQNGF